MSGPREVWISAGAGSLAEYDRLARFVRKSGFGTLMCGGLAELSLEQRYNPEDSWLQFVILHACVMKYVETSLVNGVLSKAHIDKNAARLAAQSRILARHGLRGALRLLEPQILPNWFYEKRPDIRGARCDNPCLALDDYFSPCVDHPDVLGHYREGIRRILELAPEIGVVSIWTNDSGAGTCWCSGLYPGPNGPERCKNVEMGQRVSGWLQAVRDGARDAGRDIEVVFTPLHFSKGEIESTIDHLPERTRIQLGMKWRLDFPNIPFVDREVLDHIERGAAKGRGVVVVVDPTLGYPLAPVAEPPLPFFTFEALGEVLRSGAEVLLMGGLSAPRGRAESVPTMAVKAALADPPATLADVEAAVARVARAQVGPRLAPALVSAWRDVDRAFRIWPTVGDTNHLMYPFYSVMGNRWLTRPLVPAPQLVPDEDKAHYAEYRRELPGRPDSFFGSEGTANYKIDEMKWPVAMYDHMMLYLNRAVASLDKARAALDAEKPALRERFLLQYRRVAMLAAIWRTQRNVFRTETIIDFFTGEKQDEYWHVIRKDESYYEPPTYRRLFLEAVDDEIENCRTMIALMKESDVPLLWTGAVEDRYVLGANLPEQLEKKIAVMEAHKKDIDVLFPTCPPETFADPTYEWADWRHANDRR